MPYVVRSGRMTPLIIYGFAQNQFLLCKMCCYCALVLDKISFCYVAIANTGVLHFFLLKEIVLKLNIVTKGIQNKFRLILVHERTIEHEHWNQNYIELTYDSMSYMISSASSMLNIDTRGGLE